MNLSSEAKVHIEEVLSDRVLGKLYPILEIGQEVCRAFIAHNDNFFNCEALLNNVPGNLLSYCIAKQLVIENSETNFPFKVTIEEINLRNKYKMPFLYREDISISLIRSRKRKSLDKYDTSYLKERCKGNGILDGQYSMFEDLKMNSERLHGVLIYGVNRNLGVIEFADIVFLEEKLQKCFFQINLMDKLKIYSDTKTEEEKEKNILSAQSLVADINKKMEV